MFASEDQIEAELLALRVRREVLDQAIAEREAFLDLGRRLAASLGDPDEGSRPEGARDLGPRAAARQDGQRMMDAVSAILADEGGPLHASEILARLNARGFTLTGEDPVAALNTRLWKRAQAGRIVVRMGDAIYGAAEPPVAEPPID